MRYMFAPLLWSIVVLGLLGSASVDAAPMYWDTSPDAGLQAGDGQWDLGTTASWSDDPGGSSSLLTWTSSANDAIFQADGTSLVTVFGTNVGANSIVFNGTSYTIGSQRVTVGAGGIVANESATMYGVTLGASQSVTVADSKTLTLQQVTSFGSDRIWTKEGAGTLNTAGINVGNTAGTTGTLTMTDGVLNVNGLLILGATVSTSTGILNISGGEINVSSVMYLGHIGSGIVNQTGGTVNLDSSPGMRVCTDSNETSGIYNLDGGVLRTRAIGTNAKDPDNRTMLLSFGGGTLEYTGTGLMTPAIPFEFKAGGGTISIPNAGATMHVTQEITGTGDGLLTKTGPGTLIVEGGALGRVIVSGGELIKDGAGTLTVSNSYPAPNNQALFVQSGGTYTHKQGTLNATATYPTRIDGGGVITQEGGTITATNYSVFGSGSGVATYNMQGGTLNISTLYAGWSRPGVVNQSGGTVTISGFRLGDSVGSGGSEYNLSGGSLTVTGTAAVGYRDWVEFDQSDGTTSFGNLYLGGGGSSPAANRLATYTLANGTLDISSSLWVGRDYGFTANLNVAGGTLTANGALNIGNVTANNGGASGTITQTGGQVTVNSGNPLCFHSTGTHTATYNLNGGTLTLADIQYTDTSTQQFNFGGGTLQANGTLNTDMPMTINAGGATIDTQSNTVTLGGELSGDGGLTKLGDGTLLLTGPNSYGGGTTISAGILRGDAASLQGDILNNATLVFDQTTAGTFSGALSGSGVLTKTGAAALTVMEGTIGSLDLQQGELIKDGPGTLMIGSNGLVVGAGRTYTHKAGTLNNASSLHSMRVAGTATVAQEGGTINSTGHIVLGEGTGTATYEMTGGELNVTSGVYAGWKQRGVFSHSGGTVTVPTLRVADSVGSADSQYNLSGAGSLTVNGTATVAFRDDAQFNQTGGAALFRYLNIGGGGADPEVGTGDYTLSGGEVTIRSNGWLSVGHDYGYTASLNVQGGTLLADGNVFIGNVTANNGGATGTITQTGGQVTIAPDRALLFRATGTHTAAYHLNGGTLTLADIQYTDTSTQEFNFGGGTLQANANLNTDMPMTFNLGGATIDTQAHNVAADGQLSGEGGLTKLGDGILTLTGANTYAGGTTVAGGTLMVENAAGSGTGSGPVSVDPATPGTDAILGGTGAIAGTVTVHTGGMHAPGASVGEQAIGGAIWNPGGMFQFEINDALGVAGGGLDGLGWDLITIDDGAGTGKLDLTGLSAADPFEIHVVSLDGDASGDAASFNATVPYDWVFITYDELVDDYFNPNLFAVDAGEFTNGKGQGHFAVTQVAGGLAVSFVPEPGTLIMALTALLLLLLRRRRN